MQAAATSQGAASLAMTASRTTVSGRPAAAESSWHCRQERQPAECEEAAGEEARDDRHEESKSGWYQTIVCKQGINVGRLFLVQCGNYASLGARVELSPGVPPFAR